MSTPPSSRDGVVSRVLALCRLRGGPQDLPYSLSLLATTLVVAILVDTLGYALVDEAADGLAHSLLATIVVFGLCRVALAIRGLGNRYVQTATALAGTGIVVSLVQLPILALIVPLPEPAAGATEIAIDPLQALLRWAWLATLAWQVLVYAHIVRQAMEARLAFALLLVLTWLLAFSALDGVLLGS